MKNPIYTNYFTDSSFIENKSAIDKVSQEFNLSPRILVSVLYAERGLNYSYLDEELDFLLIESGINASAGFSQIKYKTAKWIEKEMTNKKSQYWINEQAAILIGKSNDDKELIQKLSNIESNIRFAGAYLAMMIQRWKQDSINIAYSADTLGTMYSSGICSPKKFLFVNIVGNTAKEFYQSSKLNEYFSGQ
ncbi:MAG: hypothetical protein H3C35_13315 [Bacteroidetes bacterium]|nr:hypothetical protein [Bacteroidota bacterium]